MLNRFVPMLRYNFEPSLRLLQRSASFFAHSLKTLRCILPLGDFGTSSMKTTPPKSCLCLATRPATHFSISHSEDECLCSAFNATYARGSSSYSLCFLISHNSQIQWSKLTVGAHKQLHPPRARVLEAALPIPPAQLEILSP